VGQVWGRGEGSFGKGRNRRGGDKSGWEEGKGLEVEEKLGESYILIALSVRDVTVMLPILHFLWQNRPLYINCRKVQSRMHP